MNEYWGKGSCGRCWRPRRVFDVDVDTTGLYKAERLTGRCEKLGDCCVGGFSSGGLPVGHRSLPNHWRPGSVVWVGEGSSWGQILSTSWYGFVAMCRCQEAESAGRADQPSMGRTQPGMGWGGDPNAIL